MLLQHPDNLAISSSKPEEKSGRMVEEYSKELASDIQTIKAIAASFNQDETAAINRYQKEYEMHLSVWQNAQSKCPATVNAGVDDGEAASPDVLRRNRRAENQFKRFRDWRDKAMKGVQRKFLPRATPVTELESAKENLKEREDRQRFMKKVNVIIRSQKDVTARLVELLGPGSEAEALRLQQPDEQENTGYSPHELNNNNANIFRLKRRVKDLERKIGLMDRSNEEMKEMNGIRMIYNYAADRIQLFFREKPVSDRLRQLKGNGWHWSPSAGCWQRKITESAMKSADMIYKGEISEVFKSKVTVKEEKTEKVKEIKLKESSESKVKKEVAEKPAEEKNIKIKEINEIKNTREEVKKASISQPVVAKVKEEEVKKAIPIQPVIASIKEEEKAGVVEEVVKKGEKINGKAAKREIAKKEKIAAKRELKREIMIKPKAAPVVEAKTEVKKAIDWAKIAAQVEGRKESEIVAAPKQVNEPEEDATTRSYSYERYAD